MNKAEQQEKAAYHFIDYSKDKLCNYINYLSDCNSVICFDLEDSIQDVISPERNSGLKQSCRDFIIDLFRNNKFPDKILFGIRINSFNSGEFFGDLDLLECISREICINSLFLAKVENKYDINETEKLLDNKNVQCKELIAVIETKKGFRNLNEIISHSSGRYKKVAFGHCDFNLDNNIFPFHHQDSEVYWKWVDHILSEIKFNKTDKIEFINSPYLELDNDDGFIIMLSKMNKHSGGNYHQVTLTHRQTFLYNNFTDADEMDFQNANSERPGLNEYARMIIREFKDNSLRNSFGIRGRKRILISPHEYKAALNFLNSKYDGN